MRRSAGICEEDEVLRKVMQRALEQADFTVRATATGAAALATFTDDPPDVLVLLTDRRRQVVTRAELVAAGWPSGAAVTDNTLDTYLARLRRKLRDAGAVEAIRTCRGTGYELR
jgi:DNA-binding response OmpR family regulator